MEKKQIGWEERHYKIVEKYEEMLKSGKLGKKIPL